MFYDTLLYNCNENMKIKYTQYCKRELNVKKVRRNNGEEWHLSKRGRAVEARESKRHITSD
jgi:hypothetical protein